MKVPFLDLKAAHDPLRAELMAAIGQVIDQNAFAGGTFVAEHGAVTVAELLEQVLEETAADAEALDCLSEMMRCRTIVGAGTSADAQIAVYEAHGKTEDREHALQAVTDWLAVATLQ